jgi:hypothetical protein
VPRTPTLTASKLARAATAPATDDDVSVTQDGRRLASRDDVIEFLEELASARGDRDAVST